MTRRTYQVKDVAALAGVSVRALHHYDELGLLVPSARSAAGYRLYDDGDLLRLQQIAIGRELGLSLEEIRRALDEPGFDRRRALLDQRALLAARADRTAEMIRAIDRALAVLAGAEEETMTTIDDPKALFDGFDPAQHEEEARARWGDTEAFRISAERTKRYTRDDWAKMKAETAAIYADAAAARRAGTPPDDAAVIAIAERHRRSIDRWFYPCSAVMHGKLADLYEADARFAASIDAHGEGLTPYLVAAIRAAAARG